MAGFFAAGAQARERRGIPEPRERYAPQYQSEDERRADMYYGGGRDYRDDRPYGPIYQTQEQVQQSIYDFSLGRRGNIKEYWYR